MEEPQEKEPSVLQESSNGEQNPNDGSSGLKSVLSMGKSQSSGLDNSERPVVTFKENIKPREQSREQSRNQLHRDGGKERVGFSKATGMPLKNEQKKDNKRKSEVKKNSHEKVSDAGKQVRLCFCMHFFSSEFRRFDFSYFSRFFQGKNSGGNEENSCVRGKKNSSHADADNMLFPVHPHPSPRSFSSSPQQARYEHMCDF